MRRIGLIMMRCGSCVRMSFWDGNFRLEWCVFGKTWCFREFGHVVIEGARMEERGSIQEDREGDRRLYMLLR